MARRRGKSSSSKQDDSWLPLEPQVVQSSRGLNEYVIPGVLLLLLAVGGSALAWVCSDHQQTIESLTDTLMTMQERITKLQQHIGTDNAQLASVGGFEERLVALEDAYAKAQRQVELALATSEQIKSNDLQSKVWSLQTEMNNKLAELQQNTISITALNAIVKNKSVEFEVVKQSVNTMLSANTELAIQISGFSSMLSVTKLRLDEQISAVEGLMSQLESQKMEINEIKELFASNQESLATNTQELMDMKELLESEQIKRTQTLEKRLRTLYKRLEEHQTNTESLHFHLAAQMEALQGQFMYGVQQPSRPDEELQIEEQVTTSGDQEWKAPEKELEYTDEEHFAEKKEIIEEDRAKEESNFNSEQATAEEAEVSERPVKDSRKEIQPPSEELDNENQEDISEERQVLDIRKKRKNKTFQEAHIVTNKIEQTVVDEIQTVLADSDHVTDETEEIMDEKLEVTVKEDTNIHPEMANMITSESEKQIEVPASEEIQTPLEDLNTTTSATEEASIEKQKELTPAQLTGSDEKDVLTHIIEEGFSEEHTEHAVEEIHTVSNEIITEEKKTSEDGNAEQLSETAKEETRLDIDNINKIDQIKYSLPSENEQEAVESDEKSLISEKSVEDV